MSSRRLSCSMLAGSEGGTAASRPGGKSSTPRAGGPRKGEILGTSHQVHPREQALKRLFPAPSKPPSYSYAVTLATGVRPAMSASTFITSA